MVFIKSNDRVFYKWILEKREARINFWDVPNGEKP